MLKIRKLEDEQGVYILSGRMDADQVAELSKLFRDEPPGTRTVVDLKDLTLVDRDAIRFLLQCEAAGIALRNSPAYIRVWIDRERVQEKIRGNQNGLRVSQPKD